MQTLEPTSTPAARAWRPASLHFSATGAEYARLWQVNLLLTLLTLGLYRPFAKARKLRFLYAHTWIDGHPLAFHGNPWRMLGGHVLMVGLFTLYAASGYASPLVYLGAAALLALLWPALWRAGLRYRLGHTSWRGLRFGFTGSVAGAYKAMLPWVLPPLAYGLCVWHWAPGTLAGATPELPLPVWLFNIGLTLVAVPLGLAWIKRYQHSHYQLGPQTSAVQLRTGEFFTLLGRVTLLTLLALLVGGALVGFIFLVVSQALPSSAVWPLMLLLGFAMLNLITVVGVGAQVGGAMQNIAWNATTASTLRVSSNLDVPGYVGLQTLNWVLVALTLGLYRPYALVRAQRMRWQALTLELAEDPATWRRSANTGRKGAHGEMSGDFFGLDLGW